VEWQAPNSKMQIIKTKTFVCEFLPERINDIILSFYKNKQSIWFTYHSDLFIFIILSEESFDMLSKNKIKQIQSLNRKKIRDETGFFLVEGNKMVEEALRSEYQIESIVCTTEFLHFHPEIQSRVQELIETDKESIQKASLLQNPQDALALVHIPSQKEIEVNLQDELVVALDFIQDPGNLGTILRIADWFGIKNVICSENSVDVYNPKVVQASMGAIFRVKTHYKSLHTFLNDAKKAQIPVYGAFLEGENIYNEKLTRNGILVLGNEGSGISEPVTRFVTHKLFIPSFSTETNKPESLNVAIATAICCSEFRRR
jgi:TrmH family RNA methyltransferase